MKAALLHADDSAEVMRYHVQEAAVVEEEEEAGPAGQLSVPAPGVEPAPAAVVPAPAAVPGGGPAAVPAGVKPTGAGRVERR